MSLRYMPKSLAHEIRERYGAFSGHLPPEVTLRTKKAERRVLERMAQVHSFRIENPELRVPYNVPKNRGRKMIKAGVDCLENAFQWGRKNFKPGNFNEEFLQEIAGRAVCGNEPLPYRDMGTRITGSSVTPPYPHKMRAIELPWFFYTANELLKSEDIAKKVEAAIFAHLHIARIHPFFDGNGRTARTVQDVVLDHYSIPPPVIEVGERNTYYDLLDKAVYDFKHKKRSGEVPHGATEGEALFYTFIAGKINSSLDKLVCNGNSH